MTWLWMPERFRAAMVSVAGVGMPPGLIGIPFIQTVFPSTRSSASAAGVNNVSSGVSPASETPGIVDVSVFATVHVKTPLFPQILDRMSFATASFPLIERDGGTWKSLVISLGNV